MNKRQFKIVAVVMTVAIMALAQMQGVWLTRLYRQSVDRYADQIRSAVTMALYRSRLDSHSVYSLRANAPVADSLVIMRMQGSGADTVQSINLNISRGDGAINMVVLNFDNVRFEAIDSLLCDELAVRGIGAYDATVTLGAQQRRFDHAADAATGRSRLDGRPCLTVNEAFAVAGGTDTGEGRLTVQVRTLHPYMSMLGDMAGIIISSVLIVVLIAALFAYLVRTLFRFKSVERMRLDLTHNITHELKTPISVAYAAGDSLLNIEQMASDPAVRREYIGIMQRELRQLSEMVDRILRMSLEESEAFALAIGDCDAAEIVAEAVREHRAAYAGKRVEITADVGADLVLRADRFHLVKALGNLLDNAVKYSGDEVHITVRAAAEGENVVFEVADDGIGMARGEAERVFDKFYRIPAGDLHEVKGFGLGLYYVRTVAERHGGSVRAMQQSLALLAGLPLPDDTQVLPGHESFTTLGRERRSNPYLNGAWF